MEASATSNKILFGTISFWREVIKGALVLIVVMYWTGRLMELDTCIFVYNMKLDF